MTRRCFGWLPEVETPTCLPWRLRRRSKVSPSCQLVPSSALASIVLDQGQTSSCVAHAMAQAIRIRTALDLEQPIAAAVLPSRRWIYRTSREMHAGENEDRGTYISCAMSALGRLGWPSEHRCPWDERKVNAPMTVDDRRHAYDQREAVYAYEIYGGTLESTRNAVAMGYPIVFGIEVDERFCDCVGSWVQHLSGPAVGRHAMVVIGYDAESVTVLNSWGDDWGSDGAGRISWDAFVRGARDLRVIEVARRPTS